MLSISTTVNILMSTGHNSFVPRNSLNKGLVWPKHKKHFSEKLPLHLSTYKEKTQNRTKNKTNYLRTYLKLVFVFTIYLLPNLKVASHLGLLDKTTASACDLNLADV